MSLLTRICFIRIPSFFTERMSRNPTNSLFSFSQSADVIHVYLKYLLNISVSKLKFSLSLYAIIELSVTLHLSLSAIFFMKKILS